MRYLGLALFAEGSTDYYFLRPLLQRLCEDICAHDAAYPIEVSEVLGLDDPETKDRLPRVERIAQSAAMARGAWNILFVHTDGANDPQRARQQLVQPGLDLVHDTMGGEGAGVGVVPIRETEAWVIADGNALRCAFGTELTDQQLGLPAVRNVEGVADPKAILRGAFTSTNPPSRRLRQGVSPYLNTLGEQASLEVLRNLASFQALETELRLALRKLGFLR
ncbi:hypothetical protein PRtIB026_A47830 [Pseudomonas sp. RtIB026]|uniref:DUF4276 family protein n=1 Tax=Pseudomonas sp. RtIB026 TaxID=2749999 RepID=UPI0019445055|nr:DUF4276 family protein [Pseudomonas sp. RtIB026]BDU10048.1 hypothetical protein PRtIB026_A47830 [Pseudomonas sp. RtIB026]